MISLPEHSEFDSITSLLGVPEDDIARALIQNEQRFQTQWRLVQPDMFQRLENRYLISFCHKIIERDGQLPSFAVLRKQLARDLTVDNPALESIVAILDRPLPARDLPLIEREFNGWAKRQMLLRAVDTPALEALQRGDDSVMRAALDAANAIGIKEDDGIMTFAELMAHEEHEEWIVDDVLAANAPMFIGGPHKSMKTALALDLAASIAAGDKFLGRYQARRSCVLYASGETDLGTIKRRLCSIAAARRIDHKRLDTFSVSRKLPRASNSAQLAGLSKTIQRRGAQVVIIDPLYLCLDPGGADVAAGDVFGMGPLLADLSAACLDAGATPILCHHFNRKGAENAWPELRELSQAGAAEFARQWLLVRRLSAFEQDGHHHLGVVMGAGASGRHERLEVNIQDASQESQGWVPMWEVQVQTSHEQAARTQKAEQDQASLEQQSILDAVNKLAGRGAVSRSALRTQLGWGADRLKRALAAASSVEVYFDKVNGRDAECIRPAAR